MEKPNSNITSGSDVDYDNDFIEEEDQPFAHFAIRKTLTGRKFAHSETCFAQQWEINIQVKAAYPSKEII